MKYAILSLALVCGAFGQSMVERRAAWNQPFEPFHIIGNVYYVGAAGVSAFLIQTNDGLILIDGGLPETAPQIQKHIAALGFRVQDIKILLNSHAHFDHAGGLKQLQRVSGAQVVSSDGDTPTLRKEYGLKIDRTVHDGDTVQLGGSTLTAVMTPGHTRGCTTWTMPIVDAGKTLHVVFFCSTSVASNRLVNNRQYPEIVADYERSFARLGKLPCDVFLGAHPEFFHMADKRARLQPNAPNPFVDATELRKYIENSEQDFHRELKEQTAASKRAR